MIKAIFFDIDGTILSFATHKMLPSSIAAIEKIKDNGVRVFISSGRPKVLIPNFPVAFDGYITVNGGHCAVGDEVLLRNPFSRATTLRWLDYVRRNDLTTMCFTEYGMCVNRIDAAGMALQQQLGFEMPPLVPLDEMIEWETSGHNNEDNAVYQFIAMQPAERDREAMAAIGPCRMPRWHPAFTDIIPDGSSKAVGMQHIIDYLGIRRDETMAFGDGGNDVEMLEFAGIGVAMGNASDEVKAHANYVTADCESDGISLALSHFEVL
ncbi:MAG: Cof-type HAD-IIB family hydrolase [Bacteroidales bacterium]|nr:Cof-type HAD-IIB family hydrolase [Bacteroidales bacterium]